MTNAEFVEKILGIKLSSIITDPQDKCTGLRCPNYMDIDTPCEDACPHCFFWHKEVDNARVGAILTSMPELSKAFLNSIWGSNKYQTIIAGGRNSGKTYYTERLVRERSLELEGWQHLPSTINTLPIADILEILDDALDMGFDVKVDGVIYYREKA